MNVRRTSAILFLGLALVCSGYFLYANAYTKTTSDRDIDAVALYRDADTNNLLEQVPVSEELIPIFKKEGWLKVGVAKTGNVGWVNLQQWHEAKARQLKPKIETFYLYSSNDKGEDKPVMNVIAYRNGERLSDKEAKAQYEHIRKQQQAQREEAMKLRHQMARLFADSQFFPRWSHWMEIHPTPLFTPTENIVFIPWQTDFDWVSAQPLKTDESVN